MLLWKNNKFLQDQINIHEQAKMKDLRTIEELKQQLEAIEDDQGIL